MGRQYRDFEEIKREASMTEKRLKLLKLPAPFLGEILNGRGERI